MSERNGDHRWEFCRQTVQQSLENAGVRKLTALDAAAAALAKERQRLLELRPSVFIGMASYSTSSTHDDAMAAFIAHPSQGIELTCMQSKYTNSLLARGFNHLWAEAVLRCRHEVITHYAQLHCDINPAKFWCDTLWAEMERLGADIVSAVIPIKNHYGLTSVCISTDDRWTVRRLTMHEIMELPETFCIDDVTAAGLNPHGGQLLVNTGCWMADLRKPWVTATDEAGDLLCYFTIDDRIAEMHNSDTGEFETYETRVEPEDWNFSRRVQATDPNAKIYATRKVRLEHMGSTGYPNDNAWGTWEHDEEYLKTITPEQPAEEPVVPEVVTEAVLV